MQIYSAEYWASKSAIYKDGSDFQMSPLGGYSDKDEELVEYFCSCSTADTGDCQSDTTCFSGILTKYLYGFSMKREYRPQYRPHSHESSSWQSWELEGFETLQKTAGSIPVCAADCKANAWWCSDCATAGKTTLNYLGNVSYAQGQEEWVTHRFLVAVLWECPV